MFLESSVKAENNLLTSLRNIPDVNDHVGTPEDRPQHVHRSFTVTVKTGNPSLTIIERINCSIFKQ